MKIGRNDPCPCGSGKKYKKCCLDRDEAARRDSQAELGAQSSLWDEEEENEPSDDDWLDDVGVPEDLPPLDISRIREVCYERGFVKTKRAAFSGQGLETFVWRAPDIPQSILDSLARERFEDLEGEWGDPRAGTPMEVDFVDVDTDSDSFGFQAFNRTLLVLHEDSEDVRRIHRLCVALQEAAKHSGTPAAVPTEQSPPAPSFDLEEALKRHRKQGGICELCGAYLTRAGAARHFATCAPVHDTKKGDPQRLVHLRVTSPVHAGYWLDLELRGDARLDALDHFLRHIWVECCSHLSKFAIGGVDYFSAGYDLRESWGMAGGFGTHRVERKKTARVSDTLPEAGARFTYEYDFGSTTMLHLKVAGERSGRIGRAPVRLLARNTPPVWPCASCGEPATLVCAACAYDSNPFVCDAHAELHACDEDGVFLPVVNSPRMGVCGYSG